MNKSFRGDYCWCRYILPSPPPEVDFLQAFAVSVRPTCESLVQGGLLYLCVHRPRQDAQDTQSIIVCRLLCFVLYGRGYVCMLYVVFRFVLETAATCCVGHERPIPSQGVCLFCTRLGDARSRGCLSRGVHHRAWQKAATSADSPPLSRLLLLPPPFVLFAAVTHASCRPKDVAEVCEVWEVSASRRRRP